MENPLLFLRAVMLKMAWFDWVACFGVVALVLTQCDDRRRWLQVDMVVMLLGGVMSYLFPDMARFKVVKSLDAIDHHLIRIYGALMIGLGISVYQLRHTLARDDRMFRDLMMPRVFFFVMSFAMVCIEQSVEEIIVPHRFHQGLLLGTIIVGGYLYQLKHSHPTGSLYFQYTPMNAHLRLDHQALIIVSIVGFGFPAWFSSITFGSYGIDSLKLCMTRYIFMSLFASSLVGMKVPFWTSTEEKRLFLGARIVTHALLLAAHSYAFLTIGVYRREAIITIFAMHSLIVANLVLGYTANDGERSAASLATPRSALRSTRAKAE